MNKNEVYHTWDIWCLIKLKELGKSTMEKWAKAMGYKNNFNMNSIVKRNIDKLNITISSTSRLKFYEVKKDVVFKEV